MNIIYITFIDMADISSGSSVRPNRMYSEFIKRGYNVLLVSGKDMFHSGKEERIISLKNALIEINKRDYDYCYIENSTEPVKLLLNWKLIAAIHRKGIPIGYFYRDFYYKVYEEREKSRLKTLFLNVLYARDEMLIRKYVDVLYLPSNQCKSYFKHKSIKTLPPGIDVSQKEFSKEVHSRCIYVGGVNTKYGTQMLVDAFDYINNVLGKNIKLTIVCRTYDYDKLDEALKAQMLNAEYVEVVHVEGDELRTLLYASDVGLIPRLNEKYNNLSIPVKISDYITNGLPIISTPLDAEKEFFNNSKVCIFSANDSAKEFAETIFEFFDDYKLQEDSKEAVNEFARQNTWAKRVEQIEEDLIDG